MTGFPLMSEEDRHKKLEEYEAGNYLIQIGKDKNGDPILYLPAKIRLHWLHLMYPEVNITSEISWRSDDEKRIEVTCRMWIGPDFETATIKGTAFKQGLQTELDKIETKAQARCARARFGVGAAYELDFDDEDLSKLADEADKKVTPVSPAPAKASPVPATKPARLVLPTTPAKPAPQPAAKPVPGGVKATIVSFDTAILPELAYEDLAKLPEDAQEMLRVIQLDQGPREFQAYRFWLQQQFGVPASPTEWTGTHIQTIAEKEVEWTKLKDPIFGRAAWEKADARQDQISETNALATQFGGPKFKAFRDQKIPELKGKLTRDMSARMADIFLMLLRRTTQDEDGTLHLNEEGENLRATLFSDLP